MTDAAYKTDAAPPRKRPRLRPVSELVHLLWVTDEELILVMGMPVQKGRDMLEMYDKQPKLGFPQKQGIAGGRRYLPAVKAYFDTANGVRMAASPIPFARQSNDR